MRRPWLTPALVLIAACSRNTSEPKPQASSPSPEPAPAAEEPAPAPELPPGHVPVGQGAAKKAPPVPSGELGPEAAGGLRFHAEAPLVRRAPASSFRAAEYALAEAADAPLTVFFFPGQGGGIDANIARWIGQFEQPDGSSSQEAAEVSRAEVSGVKVTRVELRGTYSGGMALPGQAPTSVEDAMLLAAIAEGPDGPVFFKWVGPADVLSAHEPAFDALIASIEPKG